ncbi:sodium/hydrogen exchanger family protein, partial [Vibrio parahaemolyticus V-223/04]
ACVWYDFVCPSYFRVDWIAAI